MTDTENTLPSVVARLERDLGTARLYGEQQCARADQAERECLRLVNVICEHVAKRKEYFDRAEEAEADLAAARKALREAHPYWGNWDAVAWAEEHASAIADARAEGGE